MGRKASSIGALTIRIGFLVLVNHTCNKEPQERISNNFGPHSTQHVRYKYAAVLGDPVNNSWNAKFRATQLPALNFANPNPSDDNPEDRVEGFGLPETPNPTQTEPEG